MPKRARSEPLTETSVISNESGAIVVRAVVDGRPLATGASASPLAATNRMLLQTEAGRLQPIDATTGSVVVQEPR